jgi:hypothetical protein
LKTISLVLSVFLLGISVQSSFAASLEDIRKSIYEGIGACDQAVFTNDDYFATSLRPVVPGVGHVQIYSLKNPSDVINISTDARVSDIKIEGDTAYILTGITLEAWSLSNKRRLFIYKSHPQASAALNWRERASGFILNSNRNGNQAIISHGVLGVTVLDLATGEFTQLIDMPTVSSAQDIARVDADQAVLAVDNDDEGTFRGMYLLDLKTFQITRQIKIDNAFPSAVRVLDNNRLMMIYFNAVWKFDKTSALSAKEARPLRRAWRFPGLEVVDMQGKVAFDQKHLYACFKTWNSKTDERRQVPLAFDLEKLQLN